MPAISHLMITLPKHTRNAENPLGLGSIGYTQDKQVDIRATQAFMSMLHPGGQYRLTQVVADKSQINFDTVPSLTTGYAKARYHHTSAILKLNQHIETLSEGIRKHSTTDNADQIQQAAQEFYDTFQITKQKLVKALSNREIFNVESVPRQAIPSPKTLKHLEDLANLDSTLPARRAQPSTTSNTSGTQAAKTTGTLEAVSCLAQDRLSKLDIEIIALLLFGNAHADSTTEPTFTAIPKADLFKLGQYIPGSPSGTVLANRLKKQLNIKLYSNGAKVTHNFERHKRLGELLEQKEKLVDEFNKQQSYYPGDLALGQPHADTITIADFREQMKHYASKLPSDLLQADRKRSILSCLDIIDRQLIPGGNPALASDIMRIMHLLLAIEKIKAGHLSIGHYTDADAQTGAAMMCRLSHAKLLNNIDAFQPGIARIVEKADLRASDILLKSNSGEKKNRGMWRKKKIGYTVRTLHNTYINPKAHR